MRTSSRPAAASGSRTGCRRQRRRTGSLASGDAIKTGTRLPFETPLDLVDRFEISKHMEEVVLVLKDGETKTVGLLTSKQDLDLANGDHAD